MSGASSLLRVIAVAALATFAADIPSFGYTMIRNTTIGTVTAGYWAACDDPGGFAHWASSSINWYHNDAGQGAGKQTALQNAMASWTNVTGADYTLNYSGTTTRGWSTDNWNTVVWATGNGCTGSCLALTALTLTTGQVITEADVTFNASYSWATNGSDIDTEAVAAHEFGHTLGIHHSSLVNASSPATMNEYYFGSGGRSLEIDDIVALQCAHIRYGGGSAPAAPAAPSYLSVQTTYCLGGVNLYWASSTGATHYEVQQSPVSNYSWSWMIFSNSSTSHFHDGGAGTNYYRVRACNSISCSAYTDGDMPGQYYSPCL